MKALIILCLLGSCINIYGQSDGEDTGNKIKATNFAVPSSSAFDLLGLSPSEIHKPGLTRDFKLDWLFNENKLNPNIAIEVQPIWVLFNRNKDYTEYKNSGYLYKVLSTLNLSLGTATKDSIQSLAYGVKLNLFTAKNPIFDTALIADIEPVATEVENEIFRLIIDIENTQDLALKKKLVGQKDSLELIAIKDSLEFNKKVSARLDKYEKENWNSTVIDIGFGQLSNYNASSLDSLSFVNRGYSFWLAGITGIGSNLMFNTMFKYSNIEASDFWELGANLRYGGLKTNFFVEFLYNSGGITDYNLAYGLDYMMPNGLVVQASLKTKYNDSFNLKQLIPTVNLNYQIGQSQ